jgi:ribose/xylose/arabinose/galactoside ABC-type transport system permease subunit
MNVIKAKKEREFKITEYFVLFGLIILGGIITIINPAFIQWSNIQNIFLQITVNGILAVGMTLVIITAGIDLSVGAVLCLCGIVMGMVATAMGNNNVLTPIVLILVSLGIGFLFGGINGILITKGKLPPFIATLGMLSVTRGLALTLSGAKAIFPFPKFIQTIGGTGNPFIPIVIMIAVYVLAWFLMRYTKQGRNTYAVGGNKEAAKLSGINVDKATIIVYIISGLCSSIAGIVLVGRLNTANPTAGSGYELDAIAAAVIGGTSMTGGEGKIVGTFIGALFIGVLRNGLTIINASAYIQQIIIGVVIIVAVLSDTLRKGNK